MERHLVDRQGTSPVPPMPRRDVQSHRMPPRCAFVRLSACRCKFMHGAVRAPPYDALTADHALVQRVTCIRKRYDIVGISRAPYIGRAMSRRAHGAVGVLVGVLMGGIPFYRPRIKDHSPCMVFACPPPLMHMPHFTLPFRHA
jgi:hypothetical protein